MGRGGHASRLAEPVGRRRIRRQRRRRGCSAGRRKLARILGFDLGAGARSCEPEVAGITHFLRLISVASPLRPSQYDRHGGD